jgi:1-deoxyxylulose-5-phosphate synthase
VLRGRAGHRGISWSSVNLSLAAWNAPPWPEVLSAHDAASLVWYERTQSPLFAWSAQAAGFFSGRHNPDLDVLRTFDSEANRERRRRATELGDRKGVSGRDVALAWVLHQPFPTYAIIGPRTPAELLDSVGALGVELTTEEARWLDLEEDGWQSET